VCFPGLFPGFCDWVGWQMMFSFVVKKISKLIKFQCLTEHIYNNEYQSYKKQINFVFQMILFFTPLILQSTLAGRPVL